MVCSQNGTQVRNKKEQMIITCNQQMNLQQAELKKPGMGETDSAHSDAEVQDQGKRIINHGVSTVGFFF